MVTEIIVCSLIFVPTPSDINEFKECKEQEQKVEHVSEWLPLIMTYFPQDQWLTASLVMYCESRGKKSATNYNTEHTGLYKDTADRGLFQINSITFAWAKDKLNLKNNPYNPDISAYMSAWIVKHFGWAWWSSSEHCWGANA